LGKLAQRWAQGKDNRRVCGETRTPPASIVLDVDPPSYQMWRVLHDLMAVPHPVWHAQGTQQVRRRVQRSLFQAGTTDSGP